MGLFFENAKTIKKLLIVLIVFLTIAGLYIYNSTNYVIIRFDELGPLTKNMAAYYNGFRIGKIVRIGPDKDFKHTLVRVNLTHKNLNLPQNTSAHVERFPNGELYLQFVYPQSPSLKTIKRGDMIEGIAPYNLEEFMLGQSITGVSDIVSIHIIKALDAMDVANKEMSLFFQTTSKLIQENNKEINTSVGNIAEMTNSFAKMAENLNEISTKLNNALDEDELKDTTSNIKDTTENIAQATQDIDKTMKKIDDTISQVNSTAENLTSITGGLQETLSKRFAGMRIMFGTPVKQKSCVRNACN